MVIKEPQVPEIVKNNDISINYVMNKIIWNQNEVNVDDALAYNITMNVMSNIEDQDCQQRNGWPNWKDEIEVKLYLFVKQKGFWTCSPHIWRCKTHWVQMNFCAKQYYKEW